MNFDKIYKIYINQICKKFYLIAIIYLFLHLFFLYIDIELSHFIFIFKLENFNAIELIFFVIINLLCVFTSQFIISKIFLNNEYFVILSIIFIIPLYLSILYLFFDIIYFVIIFILDNRFIIFDYIFNYI